MTTPVLVLGGNGFIGTSLVDRLRSRGHKVRVVDRSAPRVDFDWRDVEYRQCSLDDEAALTSAFHDVECIFHLVSATVPSMSDPVVDVLENLLPTLRVLRLMGECGVERIVFFSSGGTVYGNPEIVPVPESHSLRPISSYGVVKVAIEKYLGMFAALGRIRPLILRPSNPYGPRQSARRGQGVIAAFIERARQGLPLRIWGDGETVRDYVHVDDLARFAVMAYEAEVVGAYNVGSGTGTTLNELVAIIERVSGRTMTVERLQARGFDVRCVILDIEKARTLHWQPIRTLESGISELWHGQRITSAGIIE